MSQNRSDWFNPNNPAYGIRQSQVGCGFTYSGSYSRPAYGRCYSSDTFHSSFRSNKPFAVPDHLKGYLSYDEGNDDLKLTFEGFMLFIDGARGFEMGYRTLVE